MNVQALISSKLGDVGTKPLEGNRITFLVVVPDDTGSMKPQKEKGRQALVDFLTAQAAERPDLVLVSIAPLFDREATTPFMLLDERTLPSVLAAANAAYNVVDDHCDTPIPDAFGFACGMVGAKMEQVSQGPNRRAKKAGNIVLITDGGAGSSILSPEEVAPMISFVRGLGAGTARFIAMACLDERPESPRFSAAAQEFETYFERFGLSKAAGEIYVGTDYYQQMMWASQQFMGPTAAAVLPEATIEAGGDLGFEAPPDAQGTVGGAATQASTLFPFPQGS